MIKTYTLKIYDVNENELNSMVIPETEVTAYYQLYVINTTNSIKLFDQNNILKFDSKIDINLSQDF